MPDDVSISRLNITRLILVPGLITLGVTLLRLVGELQHWSKSWFNPEAGGAWSIVGITWLAPVFGIYFACKLAAQGAGPKSPKRAVQVAVLGIGLVIVAAMMPAGIRIENPFARTAVFLWLPFAFAALFQLYAWPALGKTLFAYAFAARLPVAILMFFAMRGQWGTHYDAIPENIPAMSFALRYLWLGLLPQLVFWVGFTVLLGSLAGNVVHALRPRKSPAVQAWDA